MVVSLTGVTWCFLGFAVLSTSSCWKSQFGGVEKVNFHSIVNLGSLDYLVISSDSGTASKQSCALNKEMVGLDGEQKKVLKNLYKLGRRIVHTGSHIEYLSKCLEKCVIPKSFKIQKTKCKIPGNENVLQKKLDRISFDSIHDEKERHLKVLKSTKKEYDKFKVKLNDTFSKESSENIKNKN